MDEQKLKILLEALQVGGVSVEAALEQMRSLNTQELVFANLDHGRSLRTGIPEVVFCQGKTRQQVIEIARRILEREGRVLATRVAPETAEAVLEAIPEMHYHSLARVLSLGWQAPARNDGDAYVAIATGGTSDIPVAEEAALTLEFLGDCVERVYDVGVAGVHRLFSHMPVLDGAAVTIAIAGMEGALASVVGGLVRSPLVAVPTSIGYGASFGGLAALLAMLNSCAPGVVVVNIDNGFGAAVHAHQILEVARR